MWKVLCVQKVITMSIEYRNEVIVFRCPTLYLGDPIILEIKSLSKLFESKCAWDFVLLFKLLGN